MRRRLVSLAVAIALGSGALPAEPIRAATAGPSPRTFITPGAALRVVAPTRVADTRQPFGTTPAGRLGASAITTVQITGRSEITVPAEAVAVVLNLTMVEAGGAGYLTVFPAGQPVPEASNLNAEGGYVGANLVTVKLGPTGAIAVYSSVGTDVLVDVAGYFLPVTGPVAAGRTVPLAPSRRYDTRGGSGGAGTPLGGRELRSITLTGLPSDAAAAILNVTAARTTAAGFWSVTPPDPALDGSGAPTTSSLNVTAPDSTVASQVIVPVGPDRKIAVYSSGGGDLLIDLFGYVTGSAATATTDGLFVPLATPFRMADTRTSNSPLGEGHRAWPGWTMEVPVAGRGGVPTSGVAAIIGNLTSVDAHDAGWAAGFPAGTTFPGTSSLNNDRGGMVVPNHVFSPISARGLSVLTAVGGHVLLDVAGYVTGSATPATTPVPVNAMPIPRFPMTISIPAIGLTAALQADSQESDLKRGPGWWPGTSYPGVSGNMAVFGHRTEETAPFRLVNRLRAGDTISITGDHRRSVYEVDDWIVVPASRAEDFIGPFGGTMLTLIACSRPDGSVTSLAYRIIVRATLVDYSDA